MPLSDLDLLNAAECDYGFADLRKHHETIKAVISKFPTAKAAVLSSVLRKDYGVLVKSKTLQAYADRENLWMPVKPAASAMAASVSPKIRSIAAAKPMARSKIKDLPAYRDKIVDAIRRNPGKRAKALSKILREESIVDVQWAALYDYLVREDLYAVASGHG